MPTISVVTPSYNQGKYLEDAIRSVVSQGYPHFEHIIIDNCSMDQTLDILKKYPHLKWVSEPDKGQSDALNKGFKQATGDIIGWLNADDYYLPGTFDKIIEAFNKNEYADIIYGNWIYIDKNGNFKKKFQSVPYSKNAIIYYGPYIGSTSLFFKRKIIEENLLLNTKFKYAMDWEWYVCLGEYKKKFVFINSTLACFRVHGENQSLKFSKMDKIDRFLVRAQQLAEGYAIKRCYGYRIAKGNSGSLLEDISFRFLWWFYRCIIILKKSYYLLKSEPKEFKSYISKRKMELTD